MAYLRDPSTRLAEPLKDAELWGFDVVDVTATMARLFATSPTEPWDQRIRSSDTDRWPFPDGQFDVVFSNQVLEHVADIANFLRESRRVLHPHGTAIHVFPTRRMVVEPHLFIPLVHRLRSDRARLRLLRALYGMGLQKGGAKSGRSADRDVRYLRTSTHYRTWREIGAAAEEEGFAFAPRFSLDYLTGPLRPFGNDTRPLLPHRTTVRDRFSVLVSERLFSITLVMWPDAEMQRRATWHD